MPIEISAMPWRVVWSTDPRYPCQTRWKYNTHGARWQPWHRFETEVDAREAACANGLSQYEPEIQEAEHACS